MNYDPTLPDAPTPEDRRMEAEADHRDAAMSSFLARFDPPLSPEEAGSISAAWHEAWNLSRHFERRWAYQHGPMRPTAQPSFEERDALISRIIGRTPLIAPADAIERADAIIAAGWKPPRDVTDAAAMKATTLWFQRPESSTEFDWLKRILQQFLDGWLDPGSRGLS